MSLLRCVAVAWLTSCAAAAPTPPAAGTPHIAAKPITVSTATLSLEPVAWTPEPTRSVLSRSPERGWLDVHPLLPASSTHPLGTALVVTLAQPAPGSMPRVMLYEWDPHASRVLRALRLPGDTLEVRSIMASSELLLVRLGDQGHVELLRVDGALEEARVIPVYLGKNPSGLALVGGPAQLVVSADVLEGRGVVRRLLALDRDGAARARRDVLGAPATLGAVRHDPMVLRGDALYVVGHDPAEPPGAATVDHPALPGALGVLSFDAATLEPRTLRMTDIDGSSPANLYASAQGVLLVSDDQVLELDTTLREVRRNLRLHGPHLTLGADGAVYDVPPRLRSAPRAMQGRTCFPARLPALTLYACATTDELGQGTLAMLR